MDSNFWEFNANHTGYHEERKSIDDQHYKRTMFFITWNMKNNILIINNQQYRGVFYRKGLMIIGKNNSCDLLDRD